VLLTGLRVIVLVFVCALFIVLGIGAQTSGLAGVKPGWLPWIGDALHLVFTFGAMAWTVGLLAAPKQFDYPIVLYMVPLVVFFSLRALLGPLLYWRRVRCSVGEILGAAVAGMGLSHAVGLGVIAGLTQRDGIFEITGKGAGKPVRRRAAAARGLGAAREEGLLLLGLVVCAFGVAVSRAPGHLESALWLGVLGLQAFPYAAAMLCALLSALPDATPRTAPLRPVGLRQARAPAEAWTSGALPGNGAAPARDGSAAARG